jgi:hypothetical protein
VGDPSVNRCKALPVTRLVFDNGRIAPSSGSLISGSAMTISELQYITDEHGHTTGVVVPIDLWREINSELETQHLLKSDTMRRRLLEAMARSGGMPFEEAITQLKIDESTDS